MTTPAKTTKEQLAQLLNGRPVWEWVEKDGERDRESPNWKPNR